MTQLIILCCGGGNFHVEQAAGKQEYKLALHADKPNTVSAHRDHSLPYLLKMASSSSTSRLCRSSRYNFFCIKATWLNIWCLCSSCYTSQSSCVLLSIFIQIFIFKTFCERKPKTVLDLYADMMKKHLSYIQTPMSQIMLSTWKLCGKAKLQDCSNLHSLL